MKGANKGRSKPTILGSAKRQQFRVRGVIGDIGACMFGVSPLWSPVFLFETYDRPIVAVVAA